MLMSYPWLFRDTYWYTTKQRPTGVRPSAGNKGCLALPRSFLSSPKQNHGGCGDKNTYGWDKTIGVFNMKGEWDSSMAYSRVFLSDITGFEKATKPWNRFYRCFGGPLGPINRWYGYHPQIQMVSKNCWFCTHYITTPLSKPTKIQKNRNWSNLILTIPEITRSFHFYGYFTWPLKIPLRIIDHLPLTIHNPLLIIIYHH